MKKRNDNIFIQDIQKQKKNIDGHMKEISPKKKCQTSEVKWSEGFTYNTQYLHCFPFPISDNDPQ